MSTRRRVREASGEPGGWTAAEWEAWWGGYQSPHEDSEEDDGPQPEWERFQLEEIDALPPEVLGWILLRRAHLPSQARLSVLAATNNRLDIDLIEKALRDQEEDLLQAEERRGPKRTYWVEQEGSWGLLLDEPPGEEGPGGIHLPEGAPGFLCRGGARHLVHHAWGL